MGHAAKRLGEVRRYGTMRWRRIARLQLRLEPWCAMCASEGHPGVPANVADHIIPHRGDENLFWYGKLQSLCFHHHNSYKAEIERIGYVKVIGNDGWPLDENHPANTGKPAFGFGIPADIKPSSIPTTLVCGPPASGKSTWVAKQIRESGDMSISLDECKVDVGGRMWDTDRHVLIRALDRRNDLLRGLSQKSYGHAYIIAGAPTQKERNAWCAATGARHVVIANTPVDTCIARLYADPDRSHAIERLVPAVHRWHRLFTHDPRRFLASSVYGKHEELFLDQRA